MRRTELEHIIRAAAAITGDREIVIVDAASLLGAVPNPPDDLARTLDPDVYPLHRPELATVIDGAIGELSPFDREFGYHAHGVGVGTAVLPDGWTERLVKIQNDSTHHNIGYCLEPHDLAASKLAAGREKDSAFVDAMLKHGLIERSTLTLRIDMLPMPAHEKDRLKQRLLRE